MDVFLCLIRLSWSHSGEMAIPHYTGHMADWIMDEKNPDAFTQAITIMAIITISRYTSILLS